MKFKDFTGGLNTYDPPDNIAPNEFVELVNACYEEGSLLRSRPGFSTTRAATNVRKVYPFYVGGTLHLLYTASGGLYDNGTVLDAAFTGTFVAAEYHDMVYLCNGTYYKRYNGSTLYNVGMDAPDAPTVTASDRTTRVLDDFEAAVSELPAGAAWVLAAAPYDGGLAAGVATAGFAHDAVTYIAGTGSLEVTLGEDTRIKVTRIFTATQDYTAFDDATVSTEDD